VYREGPIAKESLNSLDLVSGEQMSYRSTVLIFFGCLVCARLYGQAPTRGQELFDKGMNALVGTGLSQNDVNAVEYLRRAADLGYAPAQVVLGSLYQTGRGVVRDPGQALDWYMKAAKQDDPLAEWLAGSLIFSGDGVLRDINEAGAWFRKSAEHDDPFGEYLLGMVKLERKDYREAGEWFRKAAIQGLPQAQQQLGTILRQGLGVRQNKTEAYMWLLLSFESGNPSVAGDLQTLEANLFTKEVEQAKTAARHVGARSTLAHGCTGWSGEFQPVPAPPPPETQRYCRE
jgi:TPR repeat protein